MNKVLLAFTTAITVTLLFSSLLVSHDPSFTQFQSFKEMFARNYKTEMEENFRRSIFNLNFAKIQTHNADPSQTYVQGINQFTDMTKEELSNLYLNSKPTSRDYFSKNSQETIELNDADIDWSALGKVSPVKSQGDCGSSWVFSAVGAVESLYLIEGISKETLSDQQIVDCSRMYNNYGCYGGEMTKTYQYIIDKGITTDREYPYVGHDQACKSQGGAFKIKSFTSINGCNNLKNALNSRPISSITDGTNWFSYKSGILSKCGETANHAVLVVGYTKDYWIIKNSWGVLWGENGYIRLATGNTCKVCDYCAYPNV